MSNIKKYNEYHLNENSQTLLQEQMSNVVNKIKNNMSSGWKGTELESSFECVSLTDVENGDDDVIVYNGWYEILEGLKYKPEVLAILIKIHENEEDLWTHDLEDTFSCVVTEDMDWVDDDGEYEVKYNGWYEDIQRLAGMEIES